MLAPANRGRSNCTAPALLFGKDSLPGGVHVTPQHRPPPQPRFPFFVTAGPQALDCVPPEVQAVLAKRRRVPMAMVGEDGGDAMDYDDGTGGGYSSGCSSSSEDTSDDTYAARHRLMEEEERRRYAAVMAGGWGMGEHG